MFQTLCGEEKLTYWTDAKLADIDNEDDLIEAYTNQPGEHHYFDDDTMEHFGTEDFHVVAPGVSVEYQSAAPEGIDRWTVVAWLMRDDGPTFTSYTLCRHSSLSEAANCGRVSGDRISMSLGGE